METVTAANDLLQNGILVETKKGLICMSLKDALSSNLNLSAQDFQNVAQQLILQQSTVNDTTIAPSASVVSSNFKCTTNVKLEPQLSSVEQAGLFDATKVIKTEAPASTITFTPVTIKTVNEAKKLNITPITSTVYAKQDIKTYVENFTFNSTDATVVQTQPIDVVKDVALDVTTEPTKQILTKRRGGWPKGRKRKPELLHLPPKAPATGYNLFLNERRKQFKNSSLAFHEITKVVGNEWSNLSLDDKKPYLEKAEEEKRRYREELREYRQSGAYQLYLAKKRRKRAKYNVFSESDMDATDDIDDEDNEELYCRTCDQWFHNLHNKREHLQGRQHLQSVAGDMTRELASDYDTDYKGNTSSISFSTSLDESSLDAMPILNVSQNVTAPSTSNSTSNCITDSITNLISLVAGREGEIKILTSRLKDTSDKHTTLVQLLNSLKEREARLTVDLARHKEDEKLIEQNLFQLWKVPSIFIVTNLDPITTESFEYLLCD